RGDIAGGVPRKRRRRERAARRRGDDRAGARASVDFRAGGVSAATVAEAGLPAAGGDWRSTDEDAGAREGVAGGKPRHQRLAKALADVPQGVAGVGLATPPLRLLQEAPAIRGSRRVRAT